MSDHETQLSKGLELVRDDLAREFPEASAQARGDCYSKAVQGQRANTRTVALAARACLVDLVHAGQRVTRRPAPSPSAAPAVHRFAFPQRRYQMEAWGLIATRAPVGV
jgi:hypothetical protein